MSVVEIPHQLSTRLNPQPSIIMEEKKPYTPHDSLFKMLIKSFFEEFIEVFFPQFYSKIDFQTMKFLSEEVIANAFKPKQRRLDIVVEAKWRATDSLIIVHVEPQSYQQKSFNERMYYYYCLLYEKYRKPIIPIAIFSYQAPGYTDRFTIKFADSKVIDFNYYTIHLQQLNWRDFINVKNPVSAALMSKMGYNEKEKIKVKLEFLRILQTLELNTEDMEFLYRFSDVYLPLSREEGKKLMAEIKKDEETFDISSLPISFIEWGKEEGREEGWQANQERVAMKMLQRNMSVEVIKEITELTKDRIMELKNKL